MPIRIGHGFDIHRLKENGKPLVIGGVPIPFDKGIVAHSDGDVLLHALCDAFLGAAALGDIGQHFPDHDPRYESANSLKLLDHVLQLVIRKEFYIINLDATILLEKPKLAPYIDSMRQLLASATHIDLTQISIKAKTMETLGDIGKGLAVAAHAVVLLGIKKEMP